MEPNEQSSPPEDFYQQQLQFADRVFFGSSNSAGSITVSNSNYQTDVFVDSVRISTPNPIIYGTGGQIQKMDLETGAWYWTTQEPIESKPSPTSLFARIKIIKEKRKRKK